MPKKIEYCYVFRSSSDPDKTYQTLSYSDGTTSCDCPGWTRRCVGGVRSCKHTRSVLAGLGNAEAISVLDYTSGTPVPVGKGKFPVKPVAVQPVLNLNARKFDL